MTPRPFCNHGGVFKAETKVKTGNRFLSESHLNLRKESDGGEKYQQIFNKINDSIVVLIT